MQFVLQSLQVPRGLQEVLGQDLLLLPGVGGHGDGVPDLNQDGLMWEGGWRGWGGGTVQACLVHWIFINISKSVNVSPHRVASPHVPSALDDLSSRPVDVRNQTQSVPSIQLVLKPQTNRLSAIKEGCLSPPDKHWGKKTCLDASCQLWTRVICSYSYSI